MTNMTGSKLSILSHPGKITGYWIITRSFPYRGPGQYGCHFSRCRKYVINSLIHGHFHIGLVIIPRSIYGGLGMITRPIWKCPRNNLYLCLLYMKDKVHIPSYLGSLYTVIWYVEYRSYFCQYFKCTNRDMDYA
jgi:hypothetical protein